jgi:tRNA-specific 2-thiouridylase
MFVLEVRPDTREVVVGPRSALSAGGVAVGETNWLARAPTPGDPVRVQIRHRAAGVEARVRAVSDGAMELTFSQPQEAVTPGQSAVVFGPGDVVIGGGRIVRPLS